MYSLAPQSILSETKRYQLTSCLEPSRALPCHHIDFSPLFYHYAAPPGLAAVGCRGAAPPSAQDVPAPFAEKIGLEANKSPGEATELPRGSLRMGRGTICQELRGYGCMSLRAGEWEALKDFESQCLSSFLWFCGNQRLSQ